MPIERLPQPSRSNNERLPMHPAGYGITSYRLAEVD